MRRLLVVMLALAGAVWAQDEKPVQAVPDLLLAGQASYMKGDYEAARQSYQAAWDVVSQGPQNDPVRYDVLKRLTSARASVGEWADADNFLQMAISWKEQNTPDDPKIADDVLLSVGFVRAQKDYKRAMLIMRRVMMLHGKQGADVVVLADDYSRVAQIFSELNDLESAMRNEQTALSMRIKAVGPLDPSLVFGLDRLGGWQVTMRQYPDAEKTYLYALVIRESMYGKEHADLIQTVDGLAYSLFGQKKYEQAEPVYQRLLALWKKSVGSETHPMVAMALDKIAVFYADWKHWDDAREATTKANAIRAYLLGEGLSVEASQRISEGKLAEALVPYDRALKVLDPPNPVYDEERSQIEGNMKELEKVVKKPSNKPPPPTRITLPAPSAPPPAAKKK